MSVNPEGVRIIMGELSSCYSSDIPEDELRKKVGNTIDVELLYCKEKGWIVEMVLKGQWRATAKGVDASIIMENKNKSCFHIGDC